MFRAPWSKVNGINKEKEAVLSLMNKVIYSSKQPGSRGELFSRPFQAPLG